MNCPNCSQIVEPGAAFCGNCGVPIAPADTSANSTGSHIAHVIAHQVEGEANSAQLVAAGNVPAYAIAQPLQHVGETKAVISLLFGALGIVGALLMAIVGLILGIVGLAFGTMSRNTPHRRISTVGIILSTIAIVFSLGVWAYAIHRQANLAAKPHTKAADVVAADNVTTPCYSTGFIDTLNTTNNKNSCNMNAFNGASLETSTKAYKVYASQIAGIKEETFNDFAKKALEKDVASSLPTFSIVKEEYTRFAGSPAYVIQAVDKSNGVAVTEAVVLHQVRAGANIFVLVQASTKGVADLSTLEAQWSWR